MYTQISDEMKKMLEADARTFLMKLQSDTFEITSGFRKIVYQGGSSGEGLAIGTTVSASVEITMEKTEHLLTGKEFAFYLGMNVDGKEEYIPMGIFKAQKPAATDWEITLKAYDRMYDAERNYASSLHYPTDTQKVMREIEKLLGISFVTEITPVSLKKTGDSDVPFAGYTIREAIGYVAGLYGKFAIFNRAGQLEFRWYESGISIPLKKMFSFERNEQDYEVQKVVGSSDSNTSYTAGSGNHGISYSNPFLTKEIVNQIYSSKHGFSYRGGTVTFLGDCRIDPWDMLQVTDLQGNIYKIPAMQITHEIDGGLTTTITAEAEEEDVEDSFSGPATKAMERTFAELLLVNKLVATKASIEYLEANYIKTSELDAVQANIETAVITNLQGKFATIEYIKANYATIGNLSAANAKIDTLEATALTASSAEIVALKTGIADINTLMFGSASGGSITTEFSNSIVANIGDAQIKSAMIKDISADKLTSGKIYTNQVEIVSRTGNLDIADNTIQIKDGKKVVRVQIGKDASGDYNIYIWDKNGKLMFDPLYGVQEDGIKKAIIRNDMISDTANISGKKIDIASLITTINEDGSSTLKASKIYVDTDKQTLDVSFKTITTKTDTAVTAANKAEQNAGTALSTANSADTKAQSVLNRANAGEFKGDKGDKGDTGATGKGVLSITPQYYLSTSNTAQSGGSWSATRPTWVTGRYYWTRDKMEWTDGSTTYSTPQLATDLNNLYSSLKTVTETVTTQGTNISTIQGQISSKVWQQDITTTVTSLQIGGRNLWIEKNLINAYESNGNATSSTSQHKMMSTYTDLNGAKYVTVQLWNPNSINNNGNSNRIAFYDSNKTWISSINTPKPNGTNYVSGIITVPTNAKYMKIGMITGSSQHESSIKIKVELGNKATDWTPAPEDVDSSISALEGTTKTLSTQYTSLNQTLSSLTATVNSNTTKINSKADGSTVTALQANMTSLTADLSGFKTTVSSTYSTKTELNKASGIVKATYNAGSNTSAYCHLAEIKIKGTYANNPITICIHSRNNGESTVYIRFVNSGGTDPALHSIGKTGANSVYIGKTGTSTWQLYIGTSAWDVIEVIDIYSTTHFAIIWKTAGVATCPSGTVAAFQMAAMGEVDYTSGGTSGSNKIPTSGSLYSTTTIANQTAEKFQWIVKSGTSATDFTITDRMASLTAQYINLNGLVTFSGLNSSVQTTLNTASRSYSFTGANGSVKWVRLGTLTSAGDSSIFCINVQSGNGYNSGAYQNSSLDITIKDGWQGTQAAAASFGVSVIRHNCVDTVVVQVRASAHNVCEVWVYFPWTYWNGNYTISGRWSNWSNNITNQTAAPTTGTLQSIEYRADGQTANSKAQGIADNIYTAGTTTINGGKITTGSITADKIKVDSLQAISAKIGGFDIDNNSIRSGTWGTDNSVLVCTGSASSKSIGGSGTISGWCFTAGSKFGVTKTGALYASDITVNGGKIDLNASSVTTAASSTTAYFRTAYSSSCYARISSGKDCSEIKIVDGNSKIFLSAESGGAFIQSYKGDELKLHYYDGYLRADEIQAKTKLTCQSFSASGSATIAGRLTATGNLELRTSGNASNIILHDDYAKHCYIRYSGARLWFLPATDSGGFELAHSASLDANTGTFYATAWGSNSSRRYKENITELTESVADRLLKIKTYHFDYKKDYGNKDMYGVIAEEVEQVHKNAVLYRNGEPDAVDYTRFIPLLIKKVQMQDKKLKYLENVVAHLIGIAMNPEQVEVEKVRK